MNLKMLVREGKLFKSGVEEGLAQSEGFLCLVLLSFHLHGRGV